VNVDSSGMSDSTASAAALQDHPDHITTGNAVSRGHQLERWE